MDFKFIFNISRVILMKVVCLSLFLIASYVSLGQHSFGSKVNVGVSYFLVKPKISPIPRTDQFYYKPSVQIGFFYNYSRKKLLLGADLIFTPIFGEDHAKAALLDSNGNIYGYDEAIIYRYVYYLGLPVYTGINLRKFNLNFGIQPNLVLKSGHKFTSLSNSLLSDKNYSALGVQSFNLGLRSGLFYRINKKLTIEASYYYEFLNPFNDNYIKNNTTWRIHQWTSGIRYKII